MERWESLRRPDWLTELQAVLIVGLVAVAGLGIAGLVASIGDPLSMQLPASAVSGTVDLGLREGATIAATQDVTVTVADPSLYQRLIWTLTALPTQAVIVALLALLLRVVWHARHNDPFTLATVRRLHVLAAVALAGGYLAFLVEFFATMYLSGTVTTRGVVGFSDVPMHWFLIGFGILAIAEVVKRGHAMRTELETVV